MCFFSRICCAARIKGIRLSVSKNLLCGKNKRNPGQLTYILQCKSKYVKGISFPALSPFLRIMKICYMIGYILDSKINKPFFNAHTKNNIGCN